MRSMNCLLERILPTPSASGRTKVWRTPEMTVFVVPVAVAASIVSGHVDEGRLGVVCLRVQAP